MNLCCSKLSLCHICERLALVESVGHWISDKIKMIFFRLNLLARKNSWLIQLNISNRCLSIIMLHQLAVNVSDLGSPVWFPVWTNNLDLSDSLQEESVTGLQCAIPPMHTSTIRIDNYCIHYCIWQLLCALLSLPRTACNIATNNALLQMAACVCTLWNGQLVYCVCIFVTFVCAISMETFCMLLLNYNEKL